jgi:hypothetical protein
MSEQESDEQTCGKGLAEHSALPAKLAEVSAAMSELLRGHLESLVGDEPNVRAERDAYEQLTNGFRRAADDLAALAARMAGYRNLPMAGHDYAALATPAAVGRFASFVKSERELFDLLQKSLERDDAMLGTMRDD